MSGKIMKQIETIENILDDGGILHTVDDEINELKRLVKISECLCVSCEYLCCVVTRKDGCKSCTEPILQCNAGEEV